MDHINIATSNAKDPDTVRWIIDTFGQSVELNMAEALSAGFTLSDVIERSTRLHNSLDLMEAFARISHLLKRRTGVKVRLPNFATDKQLSEVLEAFVSAYEEGLIEAQEPQRGAAQ